MGGSVAFINPLQFLFLVKIASQKTKNVHKKQAKRNGIISV